MKRLALLFLVVAVLFSSTAFAADPNGPDTLYFAPAGAHSGTDLYVSGLGGPYDVKIDMMIYTDNDIQGVTFPCVDRCYVPVTYPTYLNPANNTDPMLFTGTLLDNAAFSKSLNLAGTTTPTPPHFSLGAVNYTGMMFANTRGVLAHLTFTVLDTGCICLDTVFTYFPPPTGVSCLLVDTLANGYVPVVKAQCFHVVIRPNTAPVPVCGGPYEGFVGDVIHGTFTATDNEQDAISLISIVGDCGTIENEVFDGASGSYDFNTAGCSEGDHIVTVTVQDAFGAQATCESHFNLIGAAGFVWIDQVEPGVNPGDIYLLPVYWQGNVDVCGFKLMIEWDPTVLTLLGIQRGDCIDDVDFWFGHNSPHYKWEKFYYEQLYSTEIHKQKVKLVGICDMPDGYQGYPLEASKDTCALAYLKFQVKNDATLKEFKLPVWFEWDAGTYDENTFSDPTGNIWYVSADPNQFPYDTSGPNVSIIKGLYFTDGGIRVRDDGINWIGDVNVNEYPYEIADAVLFSNYFINGIDVFMTDPYWRDIQINATDVNWDGYTLTISDLVYLIRIILELETPFGQGHQKLAPVDEVAGMIASIKGDNVVISSKSDVPIGAALYVFKHAGVSNLTNLSNMDMKYSDTGSELRVLLWSLDGKSVPAGSAKLFSFEGKNVELVSVEAADNLGRTLKGTISTKSIPTNFALLGNYPNPFNPSTNISFALPENSSVSLKVYNIAGQLVWNYEKYYEAGTHTITWNGTNLNGESVSSGVYFYRLVAGANSATKKMVMTK
jgi:hypothetical protein